MFLISNSFHISYFRYEPILFCNIEYFENWHKLDTQWSERHLAVIELQDLLFSSPDKHQDPSSANWSWVRCFQDQIHFVYQRFGSISTVKLFYAFRVIFLLMNMFFKDLSIILCFSLSVYFFIEHVFQSHRPLLLVEAKI